MQYVISLPFPVSANRLWRSKNRLIHTRKGSVLTAPRVYRSPEYQCWLREADALWLTQKRGVPVMLGHYTLALTFSAGLRRAGQDGDNLVKAVHDWLEHVELIRDDRFCDAASWQWGHAPSGCHAILAGTPHLRGAQP